MNKAEEILRTYIDFEDVNGSEPVTLLPLTVIDAMEEYATQCQKDMVGKIEIKWNEYRLVTNNEDAWLFKQWLISSLNKQD